MGAVGVTHTFSAFLSPYFSHKWFGSLLLRQSKEFASPVEGIIDVTKNVLLADSVDKTCSLHDD